MSKTIKIIRNIGIISVAGIVIFLASCSSNYKKYGRDKIQNFILNKVDLFKPLKSETIIVIDNDFHECSMDDRDFVDKKYTRPQIEKVLSAIGFKKIIYASPNSYISVDGGQPISINTCGAIYPENPTYTLHIWEEILLSGKKLITINEAYSNIDTCTVMEYILEWKDNDFVISESKIESTGLSFDDYPEKKGIFYPIDLKEQSINIPIFKTKQLLSKFGLLYNEKTKNDTTFYTYCWDTFDSLSPLFKINYYEKSSKSFFKPIGAYYNPNPSGYWKYDNPNACNPDKRYNQYAAFIKSLLYKLKKFNSIDSLIQLGSEKQNDQKYVESNEIFKKVLLMTPPDFAIYKIHVNCRMGKNYYNMKQYDLAIKHLLIEYDFEHNYSGIEPDIETCNYLSMCYKAKNQPEIAKKYDEEYRISKEHR